MTIFADVTKAVERKPEHLEMPSLHKIKDLAERARAGDVGAFTELVRLYKWGRHPQGFQEAEAFNAMVDAYRKSENIFRRKS